MFALTHETLRPKRFRYKNDVIHKNIKGTPREHRHCVLSFRRRKEEKVENDPK